MTTLLVVCSIKAMLLAASLYVLQISLLVGLEYGSRPGEYRPSEDLKPT